MTSLAADLSRTVEDAFAAEGLERRFGQVQVSDRPDLVGTSRLSPHLHFGEISPRQVWREAQASQPYLRELVWREFAYHLLFHFPESAVRPLRPSRRSWH